MKILMVEDNPDHTILAEAALASVDGLALYTVPTGYQALELLDRETFDALVLDYHLPDLDVYDLWNELRRRGIDLPAIILTSTDSVDVAVAGIKAGFQDYIVKSEQGFARLHRTIQDAILRHREALSHRMRERQLETEARTDFLTGLYNRRYFEERLAVEVERARRYKRPLTVLMIDFDNMKAINDTLGHEVGSQMLAAMGELIHQTIRTVDFAARYGGDEFVVVAPEIGGDEEASSTRGLVRRIRAAIEEMNRTGRLPAQMSVSIGTTRSIATPEEMLRAADEAMYRDKRMRKAGRTE